MLPHDGVQIPRTPVVGPSANARGPAETGGPGGAGTAATAGAPDPATAQAAATTTVPREIVTRFVRPSPRGDPLGRHTPQPDERVAERKGADGSATPARVTEGGANRSAAVPVRRRR